MNKPVIGIDPGASGALAMIRPDGEVEIMDINGSLQDARQGLKRAKQNWPDVVCCIEEVGAWAEQGRASIGKFLYGAGYLHGAVDMAEIPVIKRVRPQEWKKLVGIAMNPPKPPKPLKECSPEEVATHKSALSAYKRKQKSVSRDRARELYPRVAHLLSRAKDDGRAEALLIAHTGLMILRGH